jgi:NAD(P)-dependent dehydrogenase (short-subunit alcohol dehydrogenase family)
MMQLDHTIPFDFPDLRDRVAIVTGAARGIGLAIVRQMAQAGVKVAAWDLPGTDWRDVQGVPLESRLTFEGDVGQAQDWLRILD